MIVGRDVDVVDKIISGNCEAYLKNKGWHRTGKIGCVAVIFGKEKEDGQLVEVLVPVDVELLDYKNRIMDLLLILQNFENREWRYIANDIVLSTYDTFRIVAFKGDASTSLPLNDASTLLYKSLAMMSSTAQSIISKRPHFQSKRSNEVNDFLSKLRMGHTERGSFIMTIQTPIPPSFANNLSLLEKGASFVEEPFERQVTTRLCSLISEAMMVANNPNEDTLTKSASNGMSANFFDALADIVSVCGESGANLDMTWASARPIESSLNIKNNFFVKKETIGTLRQAGIELKARTPEKNVEISGGCNNIA